MGNNSIGGSTVKSPASWGVFVLAVVLAWRVVFPPSLPPEWNARVSAALWNFQSTTWQANQTAAQVLSLVKILGDARSGLPRTLRNINVLTVQAARTSTVAHEAALQEQADIGRMSAAAVSFLAAADKNLNQGTLPALTADLQTLQSTIQSTTEDSHSLLAAGTRSMTLAGDFLAAPEWIQMRTQLAATSLKLTESMGYVAESAKHADTSLGYIEASLKPQHQGFWRGLAMGVAKNVIGPVGAALVSHFWPLRVQTEGPVTVQAKQ